MASIYNPTSFRLTAQAIGRIVDGFETVGGLTDDEAAAVCATGVFLRVDIPAETPAAPENEQGDESDEKPARGTGRRGSRRGAAEVEEAVEDERETR